MQTNDIFIFEPATTEQADALKAFGKALKLKFEIKDKKYDPQFVEMIRQGDKDIAEGKGVKMSVEEFRALCK